MSYQVVATEALRIQSRSCSCHQIIARDSFLTKYRTNEHSANTYHVNYAVAPRSNPDGSSDEL